MSHCEDDDCVRSQGKIILGRSQIRQIALERKQGLHIYCQVISGLSRLTASLSRWNLDINLSSGTHIAVSCCAGLLSTVVDRCSPLTRTDRIGQEARAEAVPDHQWTLQTTCLPLRG